ncbi:aminopeptidase N [bacterium]|nr:aminopeptidase N [bacterium]
MKLSLLALLIVFCTNACVSSKEKSDSQLSGQRTVVGYLEQSYAEYRASLISNVKYDLYFDVTNAETYSGVSKISFVVKEPKDLTVDFRNGTVNSLVINGQKVETVVFNSFFIQLPQQFLKTGSNVVEVSFQQKYSKSGSGLYRFVDPVDKNVYLYSDFEPYDANLMFPCFDQPDLKATYQTKLLAPSKWVAVSSTLEDKVTAKGEAKEWHFPESKPFSTYIYSLHAGDYKIWSSKVVTKTQTIPLRLLARQSLAKYVQPQEWFGYTKQGFLFFEDYFGHPYAYEKYDQIVVPDFNSGAMENVAAVTFNEWVVSRTKKERAETRALANVIFHEMAHMWFGNLVTMKWWNDIWLNESFATIAAYKALDQAAGFKEGWTEFYMQSKRGAYFQDQQVTTHPIEFNVANTDVVFANFDAITYGKGASVLKQLAYLIGEKAFKAGLKDYFHKHAFQNTTLSDFTGALQRSSGKNLNLWENEWLRTPQVNSINVDYSCVEGKISNAQLIQSAVTEYPVLRSHKTQIAVFGFKNNQLNKLKSFGLEYQGEKTAIPDLNGLRCDAVSIIYPNFEDYDYAKVVLDPITLGTVYKSLSQINDEVIRIGLWGALWDMVRDQKLIATRYVGVVLKHTKKEKSIEVFTSAMGRVSTVLDQFIPKDQSGKELRILLHKKWVQHVKSGMDQAQSIDEQKRWFGFYISALETPEQLKIVENYLDQKKTGLRFPIDQERRWWLISHLARYNHGDYLARLELEKKKDSSKRGLDAYRGALASVPKIEVKKEYWQKILNGPGKDMTLGELNPIIWSLFPDNQRELHMQFNDSFYGQLPTLKDEPAEFLASFMALTPNFCSNESFQQMKSYVDKNKDLPPLVVKSLKSNAQEDERCVKIQKLISQEINQELKKAAL